mgnify:CR=1 FL=1
MQSLTLPIGNEDALATLTTSEVSFVSELIAQYQIDKKELIEIHVFMISNNKQKQIEHFMYGNINANGGHDILNNMNNLFNLNGALDSLNATYWWRLISKLNFRDSIASVLTQEWDNIIQAKATEDFEKNIVMTHINVFLASRQDEYCKRTVSAFKRLSGLKELNSSFSFGKKMTIKSIKQGHKLHPAKLNIVTELRLLLNELLGRESHQANNTAKNLNVIFQHTDEWHSIDGGALRIKPLTTGDLEVVIHPELAHKLNKILSSQYPNVLPEQSAQATTVNPIKNVIAPSLINLITEGVWFDSNTNTLKLNSDIQGEVAKRAQTLLEEMGGVCNGQHYQFDYDPRHAFRRIAISGVVPDVA